MRDKEYTKTCRLRRCGKSFQTNREWQEFCHPEHQKEFWVERRKQDRKLIQIIRQAKLEDAIGGLEDSSI